MSSATQYLIERIRADVHFLTSQGVLQRDAEESIMRALDGADFSSYASTAANVASSSSVNTLTSKFRQSSIANRVVPSASSSSSAIAHKAPVVPPVAQLPAVDTREKARALWAYEATQPDDLSFNKGDILIITNKPNDHWLSGFVQGDSSERIGLFPANHVELLQAVVPASASYAPSSTYSTQASDAEKAALAQYMIDRNKYPEAMNAQKQALQPHPSAPGGLQTVEAQRPGMFQGPLGNTLAHSAVGGVGFGAGSALAGGIVRAIF